APAGPPVPAAAARPRPASTPVAATTPPVAAPPVAAAPAGAGRAEAVVTRGRAAYQPGSRRAGSIVPPPVDGHYDAKSGYYIYHTGPPVTLQLPKGQQVRNVGRQSTENQLYQFLSNPRQQVDTV